ncbi:MAG: efflux RND transporter periplasmic adaptor subunit [Verrucomicrobiota bacterium]|nr:efflux RND transporter periplasmic adaptor subunit [Verrucomicrobiota bacterium]
MKFKRKTALILGSILLALLLYAALGRGGKETVSYATSPVEQGDILQVVDATGTINAVTTVQVGSQVSGVISELHADFNSKVEKGDVIARISPALFEGAYAQAKADFENAEANVAVAAANTAKARATQAQTKADYARSVGLTNKGAVSAQAFDLAKAASDTADAQVAAAEAGELQARAQVAQKRAAVQVAQTNLDYTTIRAPIEGTVVARTVDVGQTVAASLQAPTLFTIAQDLTKMQVYAKTDESDVGGMKRGQKVTFKVDAYPRETFTGAVSQVRMNSTVVQNVVTYDTIIEFDNPELKLFPGMTAYVTIPVATAEKVIKVPNAALRFKPDLAPGELRNLYHKAGIPDDRESSGSGGQGKGRAEGTPAATASVAPAKTTPKNDARIVWKLTPSRTLEPVSIKTGITDHTSIELVQVVAGSLKPGEAVVTGVAQSQGEAKASGGPRRP